jgi:hypothetical protein
MSFLRLAHSAVTFVPIIILAGCAAPVEPIKASSDGAVSERERIAVFLEARAEYGPTGVVGHLQNAKIAGPFELPHAYYRGKQGGFGYCVNASIEDLIFGSTFAQRWSEIFMVQDGSGHWVLPEKFDFAPRLFIDATSNVASAPIDCLNREVQPFPELEAARNRRLAQRS